MTKLPRVKGRQIVAALSKSGFVFERIRGSHHFLKHSDGRCTVVPVHSGEDIGPGLHRPLFPEGRLLEIEIRESTHLKVFLINQAL